MNCYVVEPINKSTDDEVRASVQMNACDRVYVFDELRVKTIQSLPDTDKQSENSVARCPR